jgi:hypothetical protein
VQQGVKLILDGERRGNIPKIMHLDAVLSSNAFSLSLDDPKSPAGLFLNASRLNHSCVPNADYSYNNKSSYKSVFANREVDVGEEITISYSDHTKPRDALSLASSPRLEKEHAGHARSSSQPRLRSPPRARSNGWKAWL